jgi:hypothetical protein
MLLPLAMAVLLGLLSPRCLPEPIVRALAATGCLSGALALILSVVLRLVVASVPLASPSLLAGRALTFTWDGLGTLFGLLLATGLGIQVAILRSEPLPSYRAIGTCVLAGAGLAGCAAADLITLCYCWGVMDLTAMVLGMLGANEEQAPAARRHAWANAAATILTILALLLVAYDQGRTFWSFLALQNTGFVLVASAALLRLGAYPLPSSFGARWHGALVPIATGGLLWMRVGSVAPFTPGNAALVTLVTAGLLAAAIMAALAPDLKGAMPGLILHSLSMAVLAPMLDTITGFAASLMALVNVALCLTVVVVERNRGAIPLLRRWDRLPSGIAWASLMGCPLTLGFAAHWLFLRVCWLAGAGWILTVSVFSFLLVAVQCWRAGRQLLQSPISEQEPVSWRAWPPFVSAAVPALVLILAGLNPAWLERIWRGGFPGFDLPSLGALFSGGRGSTLVLLLATVVIPMGGAYSWLRWRPGLSIESEPLLTRLGATLSLEWFYLGIEQGLLVIQRLLRRILNSTEESFFMGWILVFSASVLLFLIKR